jgi:predicted phosphodiesterase
MSVSILDSHRKVIENLKRQGFSNRYIAVYYGVSEKSIRRALKRWDREDSETEPNEIVVEAEKPIKVTDPDELMHELGVNPEEWHVDTIDAGKWGNPQDPSYKLSVKLKNKRPVDLILPVQNAQVELPVVWSSPKAGEPKLTVYASDFHAPFHDRDLFRRFLQFLAINRPHEIIIGGDLNDFPEQSRHRHKPEWKATVMDCVNGSYGILLAIRKVCPDAKIIFLPGNHDERIRNAIIDHNNSLFDLRPADKEGEEQDLSVWDLRNILRLDELGVEYVDPQGTYEYSMYEVSPKLAATHGWVVKGKSAQSAQGTLESLGHSVLIGHTHRRGFYYLTVFEIDGTPRDLVAVEAGCMCLHKKGLGYARAANWQQGFVTAQVFDNGAFNIEPAVHVNEQLIWRDQVFA